MAESGNEAVVDDFDGDDMSPIDSMREMIEYIARSLTSNPDTVSVTEEYDGERILLHLSVDDQDKGKVIGRDGRVAQSMRALLRVAAVKSDTRVSLEID
ncbi:MAG TPA: KH domain-containing protein [Dehalococcoidia bacterium]|nr:KH domain-containing protein [Dehalococcoidia bacterium]MDP7090877.1 KH domain-containing protein [Dehalococcoidia bacterium]MDP7261150.1 KH domain-containing protein [Dehalococcoidia bacterium]MDP7485567.1 KH domain-containing protein [Dehalococcoidia bacterium]HJP28532.1 KH domain-containing protein [Dehalococcoidia bacterium]